RRFYSEPFFGFGFRPSFSSNAATTKSITDVSVWTQCSFNSRWSDFGNAGPRHCGVRSEAVERESIAMRSSARRVSISSGVIGNGGQAWITKQRATPRDHDRSPDSRAARSPSTPVLDLARTHGDPKAAAPPEV